MTSFGCFSIVQKHGTGQLTVRARVRSDLDRLRDRYLPTLTPTLEKPGSDYRHRATASHADLGAAMAGIVNGICYDNSKSEVERVQGHARERGEGLPSRPPPGSWRWRRIGAGRSRMNAVAERLARRSDARAPDGGRAARLR